MTDENLIRVKCSNCGATAKGRKAHLEQKIKCPNCEALALFESIDLQSATNLEDNISSDSLPLSNPLIDKLEQDYKEALHIIDNEVPRLIKESKEMRAIILCHEQITSILNIHDVLQNIYYLIYNAQGLLERSNSIRFQQLTNKLVATRKIMEETGLPEESFEKSVLLELKAAGFETKHWAIKTILLTEIEYMISILQILVEPDFIPLESEGDDSSKDESNRHIPSSVKIAVWRRDLGKCIDCGSREKLEYDHLIPVSKGGSNTDRNIQLLCQNCNRKKAATIQ